MFHSPGSQLVLLTALWCPTGRTAGGRRFKTSNSLWTFHPLIITTREELLCETTVFKSLYKHCWCSPLTKPSCIRTTSGAFALLHPTHTTPGKQVHPQLCRMANACIITAMLFKINDSFREMSNQNITSTRYKTLNACDSQHMLSAPCQVQVCQRETLLNINPSGVSKNAQSGVFVLSHGLLKRKNSVHTQKTSHLFYARLFYC